MGLNYTEREEGDIFVFSCEGRFDQASLVAAFETALQAAAVRNADRLLFDCRGVTGVPTTVQRFEMGTQAAELYRLNNPGKKLAVAMLTTTAFLDPNRFGQTVARNRGLMGLTTDDLNEAMEFLKEGSS